MKEQSLEFQLQAWNQQRTKLSERESRWTDVASYILNRGEREWIGNIMRMMNQWKKWRVETREEITRGEKQWIVSLNDFNGEMERWQNAASKEGAGAATREMAKDAQAQIDEYVKNLQRKLPGGVTFSIDTASIVNKTLENMPSGIGVLAGSMNNVDTAAGFSAMLNLGLGGMGDLQNAYDKQMEVFQERMEIMRTVQMAEMAFESFQEMLKQFNTQLAEANTGVYDQVNTELRQSSPYKKAPFKRGGGEWTIRVITDYSLAKGKSRKTLHFADYKNYENTTVYLRPLKGLEGGAIDFNNPYTYESLSTGELDAFIQLEQNMLNREINLVFGEGGYFSTHSNDEFGRLGGEFGSAYQKWMEGEALGNMKFYSAPIVPGGPNLMTVAKVAGTVAFSAAGMPWAAFAFSSALTAVSVADGSITWQQGLVQIGISAATTYIGGQASALGSSVAKEVGGGVAGAMVGAAVSSSITATSSHLMSGIQWTPGKGLNYDSDKVLNQKALATIGIGIVASSVSAGVIKGMKFENTGLAAAATRGTVDTTSKMATTPKSEWGEVWKTGMINTFGNYLGQTLAGGFSAGAGIQDEYSRTLLSNFTSYLARDMLGSHEKLDWNRLTEVNTLDIALKSGMNTNAKPLSDPVDAPGATDGHTDSETMLGGLWTSLRSGFVNAGSQIISGIRDAGSEIGSTYSRLDNAITGDGRFMTSRERDLADSQSMWADGSMQKTIDVRQSEMQWASGYNDVRIIQKYAGDIVGNFYKDSKATTDGKIAAFGNLGYNTSILNNQVNAMRMALSEQYQAAQGNERAGSTKEEYRGFGTAAYAGDGPTDNMRLGEQFRNGPVAMDLSKAMAENWKNGGAPNMNYTPNSMINNMYGVVGGSLEFSVLAGAGSFGGSLEANYMASFTSGSVAAFTDSVNKTGVGNAYNDIDGNSRQGYPAYGFGGVVGPGINTATGQFSNNQRAIEQYFGESYELTLSPLPVSISWTKDNGVGNSWYEDRWFVVNVAPVSFEWRVGVVNTTPKNRWEFKNYKNPSSGYGGW